jgi:hypothetical protein
LLYEQFFKIFQEKELTFENSTIVLDEEPAGLYLAEAGLFFDIKFGVEPT